MSAVLLSGPALFFLGVALFMLRSAFKASEPEERKKLLRQALGSFILALMGLVFAWYSSVLRQ